MPCASNTHQSLFLFGGDAFLNCLLPFRLAETVIGGRD